MASESNISNEIAITLVSKLQDIAPRLRNEGDKEAQKRCLEIGKELTHLLENPENTAVELMYSPLITTVIRIAVDLNLFETIAQNDSVTSTDLAKISGGEEQLILRILRVLSAVNFVEEIAITTWKATDITKVMAKKEIAAGHRMMSQLVVPAVQAAPAFFGENGYSFPVNYKDGILQFAFGTKKTGFDYILSNNSLARDFNEFMGNTMGARKFWVDWYPIESRILNEAVTDKALIVDVGGGKGHDILSFKKKFPGAGRLVLQDLAGVTETIQDLDEDIEKVEYDFFTEQPIKGARAYFYHHILHDWSDECCLETLEQVVSAMAPGYSKLVIHDMILPEIGVSLFQAELDIAMIAFDCGAERTRSQWRALLEKAGLHSVEFWESPDDSGDGIIEAVKN